MQTNLVGRRVRGQYATGKYKNDVMIWAACEGEVVAVGGLDYLYLFVLDNGVIVKVPYTTAVVVPREMEHPLR